MMDRRRADTGVRASQVTPVPERPADVEQLWTLAQRLSVDTLPVWLEPAAAGAYRRVAAAPPPDQWSALESAGLIVDASGVYIADPTQQAVFSVGVCEVTSPLEPAPPLHPALTRDDVTDIVASFVADPFLLRAADGWHMFFEVWNWRENKGEIGHATSRGGLDWCYDRIVLAEEFHLSYPYVVEHAGERWMVPEGFQAGAVRLYRADPFPWRWTLETTLLEAEYVVDASPFCWSGRWWLYAETSPQHDTLRIYSAEELRGPWREHPASPVVSGDPSRSRPAGRPLVDGERVVRFAQDCSREYGKLVRAFEVTELTPTRYVERELPGPTLAGSGQGWNARGMHHLDAQQLPDGRWLAAVDGWR